MAKPTNISPAEWDVMEVVWEAGPCAAAEVIARLALPTIGNTAPFAHSWPGSWKKGSCGYRVQAAPPTSIAGRGSQAMRAAQKAAPFWARCLAVTPPPCWSTS